MSNILESILRILAQRVLAVYRPIVIGVTGSMGKTSAKEAIYTVVKKQFTARRNIKSYNNELGVPLTILGVESAGRNIFKWLRIIVKTLGMIVMKNVDYPQVLILEMAADKPGDIEYLTNIAPCTIGVLTAIAPVHLEKLGSIENVMQEKKIILTHLVKDDFAVMNTDDKLVKKVARESKAQKVSFGFTDAADVTALDVGYAFSSESPRQVIGMRGKFVYKDSKVPFVLPGLVGEHQLYAALAAASVGVSLGMNLVDIGQQLKQFHAPRGRLNLIPGINDTVLIDDTYNSSPQAAVAALSVLHNLPREENARTFAVLGDMNELGESAKEYHLEVGKAVQAKSIEYLCAYGKQAKYFCQGAHQAGMPKERIMYFKTHAELIDTLKSLAQPHDVLLFKGSQNGVFLEEVVKGLMRDPDQAEELLVRQWPEWMTKKQNI